MFQRSQLRSVSTLARSQLPYLTFPLAGPVGGPPAHLGAPNRCTRPDTSEWERHLGPIGMLQASLVCIMAYYRSRTQSLSDSQRPLKIIQLAYYPVCYQAITYIPHCGG
jgi:hypothetical protein